MDIGSWVKNNKLLAGGIAAGAGFMFLSHRGSSSSSTVAGELVPVATAPDTTSTDTSPFEQAAQAAQDAADAAGSAADAAQTVVDSIEPAPAAIDGTSVGDTPLGSSIGPVIPTPSSQTSGTQTGTVSTPVINPTPVAQAVIPNFPLPSDYTPGAPFGVKPPNAGMLIGTILGYKNMGTYGSNSTGGYTTIRFFTDLGNTGDWNWYSSGAKKGEWVGPFNFPRHSPGG